MEHLRGMGQSGRSYLRQATRAHGKGNQNRQFRETLAQADADKAEVNRKADQVRVQKATKKQEELDTFQPVLDLLELKKMGIGKDRLPRIRQQLIWHRDIGKDVNLKGIHGMNKEEAWGNMICAVRQHQKGASSTKGV